MSLKDKAKGAFSRKSAHHINIDPKEMGRADAALIIDEAYRAKGWAKFLVSHSGGYDAQYYTHDEAKAATILSAMKFLSVSAATYAFMKAVGTAFESKIVTSIPSIGGVDPKLILMGGTAGILWWGLSKMDTAVMHGMRARKTARHVKEAYEIGSGDDEKNISGILFRYGVSAASLGITVPALLITVSEGVVNNHLKARYDRANAPIIEEYKGRLKTVDDYIAELRTSSSRLQTQLSQIQVTEVMVSEGQRQRLDILTRQLISFKAEKVKQEEQLIKEQVIRDEAIAKLEQEAKGTRGSKRGEGPLWGSAVSDRDDALRRIKTIEDIIARLGTNINTATEEITSINQQISEANQKRQEEITRQRANIQKQIDDLTIKSKEQTVEREKYADINALAAQDPRFKAFNPGLAEQIDGYIEYMTTQANELDLSRAGFAVLLIVCIELGVFALSAWRRVNPGEIRGYLAELIKSEQAGNAYNKIRARQTLEEETLTDDDAVLLKQKRDVMRQEAELFQKTLSEMMSDPVMKQRMQDRIAEILDEINPHKEPANHPPQPDTPRP